MTNRSLLLSSALGFAACSQPHPRQQPPPMQPPPPPVSAYVEYEVHGTGTGSDGDELGVHVEKDQPPNVKLKLGHYRNARRGIGVTIDLYSARTEDVADIDPAKLRFDGEDKVWLLEGMYGGSGRIDYVRDHERILLQVHRDGRMSVYVPDPETDRSSEAIDVFRDADTDPL
jgi:hypothetical protein